MRLGYRFGDDSLLVLSLTHRSAGKANNERLEFLGDSLINHVIAEQLYRQFPEFAEGKLTRLRAKLVRGSFLATIAARLDLGGYLIMSASEQKSGGRLRKSICADALEAVAGAILLDAGFETAKAVVLTWFDSCFDGLALSDERDAKTRLQEWLQGKGYALPQYDLLQTSGPAHEQTFVVTCCIEPVDNVFEGIGKSRREAEQSAAKLVLEELAHV